MQVMHAVSIRKAEITFERTDFCDPRHTPRQERELFEGLETERFPWLDQVNTHLDQLADMYSRDQNFRVVSVTQL